LWLSVTLSLKQFSPLLKPLSFLQVSPLYALVLLAARTRRNPANLLSALAASAAVATSSRSDWRLSDRAAKGEAPSKGEKHTPNNAVEEKEEEEAFATKGSRAHANAE
jgi:hypothetical protein